jgi:hypothetical protein
MFSSVESRQPIKGVRAQNFSGELGLFTQGRRAVLYFGFTSLVSSATSKEHGANAPSASAGNVPSISPRLAKTLGRHVALHGTKVRSILCRHIHWTEDNPTIAHDWHW